MCGIGIKTDIKTNGIKQSPGSKSSHTQSNDFWQGCQDHSMGKGQSFQQMVLGKLDIRMQKNAVRPKCKTIKLWEEIIGIKLHNISKKSLPNPMTQRHWQQKKKQTGLHENFKKLYIKDTIHRGKKQMEQR